MKEPGKLLVEWRTARKLTQHELAAALDIREQRVCFWEIGRSFPSLVMAFEIERVTGIPAKLWADAAKRAAADAAA